MSASKYEVRNDKIYIETIEGILVFIIDDDKTIRGDLSILKGEVYKK